jgi:hypothetical protein
MHRVARLHLTSVHTQIQIRPDDRAGCYLVSETRPDTGKTLLFRLLADGTYTDWASGDDVADKDLVDRLSDAFAKWEWTQLFGQ